MSGPEAEPGTEETPEKPKLQLDVNVEKPSACTRHITVTIPRDDLERYFEDAFSELMPSAHVPGFRAGRAPRKLVEQRFRDQVSDQVKSSLLMDTMSQISEDYDFSAISEPDFDFDAIELPESGPMTFEFDLEVRPEFDLPKWKGLKLERLTRDFTREDLDQQLKKLLREDGELVPYDGAAEAGDYVVVNIRSRLDGKQLAETEEVTIPVMAIASFPDARVEDFGQLMEGCKAGDKPTTTTTISHDVPNVDLQGQEIEVEFEVLEVKKLELPELDEAFLERFGVLSEGELRDRVKEEMERQMQYQQNRRVRRQITGLLTENVELDLPPDLVRRQADREMDRAILEMRSAGFSQSEIKAYEHELRQNSLASTRRALQEHFILERIAEEEGVEAEPEDYDMEIAMIAQQSRESVRRTRARIEKRGMMDALRNQIVERKVLALIEEHADFKDVKFEPEKEETAPVDFRLSGTSAAAIPEAKHGDEAQPLHQPVDRT